MRLYVLVYFLPLGKHPQYCWGGRDAVGRYAVDDCQVLGPRCVACVDVCRLPRSDNVSGMMREVFFHMEAIAGTSGAAP